MNTYQVSIFLENKKGHFHRVSSVLSQSGVNIRTMTITDTASGWGVLNLVVDRPEVAVEVLTENNFTAVLRDIVILKMGDKSGSLNEMLCRLDKGDISFNNAYGRIVSKDSAAFLVLDIDHSGDIVERLSTVDLTPLTAEETYKSELF